MLNQTFRRGNMTPMGPAVYYPQDNIAHSEPIAIQTNPHRAAYSESLHQIGIIEKSSEEELTLALIIETKPPIRDVRTFFKDWMASIPSEIDNLLAELEV
jgi:hypothetical protein